MLHLSVIYLTWHRVENAAVISWCKSAQHINNSLFVECWVEFWADFLKLQTSELHNSTTTNLCSWLPSVAIATVVSYSHISCLDLIMSLPFYFGENEAAYKEKMCYVLEYTNQK